MTDPQQNIDIKSFGDPSKINPYGASTKELEAYSEALNKGVEALQQRYENPNWFKVAAGFLKPQLGGFGASLGSAAQAMGENVELQRAQEFPIAQMRAQIAQTNILLGQNKSVSDEIQKWRSNPATKNQLPPVGVVGDWLSRAPNNPAAQSFKQQLEDQAARMRSSLPTGATPVPGTPATPAAPKPVSAEPKFSFKKPDGTPMSPQEIVMELSTHKMDPNDPNAFLNTIGSYVDQARSELKAKKPEENEKPAPKTVYPMSLTPPNVEGLSDINRTAIMGTFAN